MPILEGLSDAQVLVVVPTPLLEVRHSRPKATMGSSLEAKRAG